MIIEESDFKLEQVSDTSDRFDLDLLRIVNKGKANERAEFKNEAYGISLVNAMKKIILYRMNLKSETLSLKEFLKEYKIESEKICKLLVDVN